MRNRFNNLLLATTFVVGCATPETKKYVYSDRIEEVSEDELAIGVAKSYVNGSIAKALKKSNEASASKRIDLFGDEAGNEEVKEKDSCPKGQYRIMTGKDKGDCVEMSW